ncbi:response regulator transcription factor [Pseudomonas violetae]|jgi:two-component system, NarL family, response regulator EvgA|uniref:Response regulator transcription factor n=1 Tax=Pseudomonas violetae TaxID=2915813 RepID=A0ABT0F586_9PSED|nr:response regulator transcription factor [Pseudomonas violetae]MCK1793142.1 response regulator transcription factor [Pseudomonas violetae]
MKSALIVDDHPVVRAAVKIVLRQEGFHRIYEASCGNEVMLMIREHQPELLVLDLSLPTLDGLEVLARIHDSGARCRVVVFTSQEAMHYQDRCIRAGASAYVPKSNDLQDLHKAIHAVMAGYTLFAQLVSNSVALSVLQRSEGQRISQLSDRELTILRYLANGISNKEIAATLHLSHKTVSTYKTRLIEKLDVKSSVYLRDFALRNRLI